ncbi:MAG TPA: hypothetical protein VMT70_02955 [Vicinamibacteria bacterium]|nr:hypothetical protein [Vicinamibacteria bacterium]
MRVKLACPSCGAAPQVAAAQAPPETSCPRCGQAIALSWTESLRAGLEVDECPLCRGRDHYVRKDLNRSLGLASVVVVGLVSAGLLWSGRTLLAYGVLGALALLDLVIYGLMKDVTVCYRCQAEFRGSYRRTASPFDLHTAETLELEYSRRRKPDLGVRSGGSPLP